jgi:hypothetical protein
MNFASEASKLLTNKYFLYFIVFLAASNVLGYIVTNKVNAVIFFALVAFLVSNFSKNMSVILLVAIIATNLLMANKTMREGLENGTTGTEDEDKDKEKEDKDKKDTIDTEKLDSVDHELGDGLKALTSTGNVTDAKEKLTRTTSMQKDTEMGPIDPNNRDLNKPTTDTFKVKGHTTQTNKKSGFSNPKRGSAFSDAAPVNGNTRIDYASTLEGAYDNLDKILGSDGINKLTGDTQKLMTQQQKLFDTMQGMLPMINQAKEMMNGIDMTQLNGLANMATSLGGNK